PPIYASRSIHGYRVIAPLACLGNFAICYFGAPYAGGGTSGMPCPSVRLCTSLRRARSCACAAAPLEGGSAASIASASPGVGGTRCGAGMRHPHCRRKKNAAIASRMRPRTVASAMTAKCDCGEALTVANAGATLLEGAVAFGVPSSEGLEPADREACVRAWHSSSPSSQPSCL
ncbi:hypothetical protein GGX14DRAFT_482852, partial [Mycena pura]